MEPGEPAVHAGHLHRIAKAQLAAARAENEAERAEKELREAGREDARQTEELSMRRAASGHYSRQVRPAGPWSKVSDAQQHTLSRLQVEEETSQAAADAATARHAEAVQWSEEAGEKNRISAEALDHVEASEIPLPTIYVSPDDKEWLAALMWARTAMQQGELDDALAAERAMTEVERTDLVDARLVGGPDAEICYVCADSERTPSEALVRQAMSWARENPDWEPPSMEERLAACMSEREIRNPKYRGEELDRQSLQMVLRAKAEVRVGEDVGEVKGYGWEGQSAGGGVHTTMKYDASWLVFVHVHVHGHMHGCAAERLAACALEGETELLRRIRCSLADGAGSMR